MRSVAGLMVILALGLATSGYCQMDELGDLGLGGLGGGGGLGLLGALGGLGAVGGLSSGAAAPQVVVNQPVALISDGCLFVIFQGHITKYDCKTLAKLAETTYPVAAGATSTLGGSSTGPQLLQSQPTTTKPPLVPGAKPSTGPK
ncbi:hypothetical protein LLH03_17240 [bacterium]|nr:hypothetical protein [bacterium]